MANIGRWLSTDNTFSGFVLPDDAKSYHLRRLVKLSGDKNKEYEKDSFELLDKTLLNLEINLTPEKKDYPWVPNTGELYKFTKIEIKGNYIGGAENLVEKDRKITILPPLDMYHFDYENSSDATDKYEDDSNIYQNKGAGLKFYAMKKNNAILLATFKLKSESEIKLLKKGESPYKVVYNRDIFVSETDPTPKYDYELYVDRDKLSFKAKNYETTNNGIRSKITKIFTQFAVRPLNNNTAEPAKGNIRPGDDFLLRFGVLSDEAVTGVVDDEDFIAVYDKKMLWRANLYINENNDWNEKYPWNAPSGSLNYANNTGIVTTEDHYNEFGFVNADGSSDTSEIKWYGVNKWNILDNNQNGELGKQVIKIFSWNTNNSSNSVISSAIPYVYGGKDSVFNFNVKMTKQMSQLSAEYLSNGTKFLQSKDLWPIDGQGNLNFTSMEQLTTKVFSESKWVELYPNDLTFEARKNKVNGFNYWKKTTAPENKWDNYSDETYRPMQTDDDLASISSIYAGIDCAGFVQQARNIESTWDNLSGFKNSEGNAYGAWNDYNDSEPKPIKSTSMKLNTYSYEIPVYGEALNSYNRYIVPGDIFVQDGHVTIFLNISYLNKSLRKINISSTLLIEATPNYIKDSNTMNFYIISSEPRRIK